MKLFKLVILLFIIASCLTTCKRYPEGGFRKVFLYNLFGPDSHRIKDWYLKKYEVNGVDSTSYIISGNGVTNFSNEKITFISSVSSFKNTDYLFAESKIYSYHLMLQNNNKSTFVMSSNYSFNEPQCKKGICERNIFNPEKTTSRYYWKIVKLTSHTFISTTTINNNN